MSPSGGSTFTTSAPMSASMRPANGPASTRERSRTRSDASGASTLRSGLGRRLFCRPIAAWGLRGRRRTERVRRDVYLLELHVAGQHRLLPGLMLGLASMELGHHLARKQLEAGANVLVGIVPRLIEQDHLVDVRLLELMQLA